MPKIVENLRIKLIELFKSIDTIQNNELASVYTKSFILMQDQKMQLLIALFLKRNLQYIKNHTNEEIIKKLEEKKWWSKK